VEKEGAKTVEDDEFLRFSQQMQRLERGEGYVEILHKQKEKEEDKTITASQPLTSLQPVALIFKRSKKQLVMPLKDSVYLLLVERSAELLLPYLDKTDIEVLSRVNSVWLSNISSFKMFSTLFKSIKDVVKDDEAKSARKPGPNAPQKFDKNKVYTTTRVLPRSVLRKAQEPTPPPKIEEE
jgi:hypothetical protein